MGNSCIPVLGKNLASFRSDKTRRISSAVELQPGLLMLYLRGLDPPKMG